MFCTNGVLLRMLTHGDGLSDITHVRLCLSGISHSTNHTRPT